MSTNTTRGTNFDYRNTQVSRERIPQHQSAHDNNILSTEKLIRKHRQLNQNWIDRIKYCNYSLFFADSYVHFLMSLSWLSLFFLFAIAGFLNALFFAVLYFLVDCYNCEMQYNFFSAWNLSVQTFLTIGYGTLTPRSTLANIIVFFQGFTQVVMSAIFTGIPYLKFSKPRSRLLFSSHIVVGVVGSSNVNVMKFKLAVIRNNNRLFNVKYSVNVIYSDKKNGGMLRILPLKITNEDSLLLTANYTIEHILDEESAIYNIWNNCKNGHIGLKDCEVTFHVNVVGWDPVYQSEVNAYHFYSWKDIHFNCRYDDMIQLDEKTGTFVLHLNKINSILKQNIETTNTVIKWIGEQMSNKCAEEISNRNANEFEMNQIDLQSNPMLLLKSSTEKKEHDDKDDDETTTTTTTTTTTSTTGTTGTNKITFRIMGKSVRKIPIIGHNGTNDLMHGTTWYWYVLNWKWYLSILFIFIVYFILINTMAIPLYLTNLYTNVNLLQDVDQATGKIIINNVTFSNSSIFTTTSVLKTSFSNSFFFAHQTISSIGYGVLSPRSDATHWYVTIFGFFGFIIVSLFSGGIWSKFTNKRGALVATSNTIVINHTFNKKALMFRMAGLWRKYPITSASVTAVAYLRHVNPVDGQISVKGHKLKLLRNFNPLFILPTTFVHIMDDNESPFKNLSINDINDANSPIWINLVFEGLDTCLGQIVAAENTYTSNDIQFNRRFQDIITFNSDDQIHIDMSKFHETIPI